MVFIGRLFGFLVFTVFVGAIFLNLADQVNVTGLEEKLGVTLSSTDFTPVDEVVEVARVEQVVPAEFKPETPSQIFDTVKVSSISELEKVIYLEKNVVLAIDNKFLKNPFVGHEGQILVNLVGFDEKNFYSDGSEIGALSFVYVKEVLFNALSESNGSIWVVK
jgi:hypothetical protein